MTLADDCLSRNYSRAFTKDFVFAKYRSMHSLRDFNKKKKSALKQTDSNNYPKRQNILHELFQPEKKSSPELNAKQFLQSTGKILKPPEEWTERLLKPSSAKFWS